eukprot:scaffold9484_cov124-Isochrysis_galbana.AAC.3
MHRAVLARSRGPPPGARMGYAGRADACRLKRCCHRRLGAHGRAATAPAATPRADLGRGSCPCNRPSSSSRAARPAGPPRQPAYVPAPATGPPTSPTAPRACRTAASCRQQAPLVGQATFALVACTHRCPWHTPPRLRRQFCPAAMTAPSTKAADATPEPSAVVAETSALQRGPPAEPFGQAAALEPRSSSRVPRGREAVARRGPPSMVRCHSDLCLRLG